MRLKSVNIKNFKGIANVEIDDLQNEAAVVISGRNGTGKSLLLEAIVAAWSGRHDMHSRIGPWGDQMFIELAVELTATEESTVESWRSRFEGDAIESDPHPRLTLTYSRDGSGTEASSPTVVVLRNESFQNDHPFAVVDFLAANRLVPNSPDGAVDLSMLNVDRVAQERFQLLHDYFHYRNPMSLPNVSSYLITLDYQSMLAQRQGLDVASDYEVLQSAFYSATGKRLLLPEYDPAAGSRIQIELPTYHRHGLNDLSSGEQEMLAMMYFVRRLSASGGILCIDEPEQHLHPSLQASLFEAMQGLADRAQVFVVSHSVNLINSAPLSGLLQVSAPTDATTNQCQRLTDTPSRLALMGELGITGADLAQNDMILVVEGDTDSQWLRALFPVELARTHLIVAGGANEVQRIHRTLEQIGSTIPWFCIRDRDLLSDEEVRDLQAVYPNMHIWPLRSIESIFLNPTLIAHTMQGVGSSWEEDTIEQCLEEIASPLQDEVLAAIVEAELRRRIPAPETPSHLGRFERMKAEAEGYADVNKERAAALDQVREEQQQALAARWGNDWRALVNPKKVLAALNARLGYFKTAHQLMTAMVARARDVPEVRPVELKEVHEALVSRLGAAASRN